MFKFMPERLAFCFNCLNNFVYPLTPHPNSNHAVNMSSSPPTRPTTLTVPDMIPLPTFNTSLYTSTSPFDSPDTPSGRRRYPGSLSRNETPYSCYSRKHHPYGTLSRASTNSIPRNLPLYRLAPEEILFLPFGNVKKECSASEKGWFFFIYFYNEFTFSSDKRLKRIVIVFYFYRLGNIKYTLQIGKCKYRCDFWTNRVIN